MARRTYQASDKSGPFIRRRCATCSRSLFVPLFSGDNSHLNRLPPLCAGPCFDDAMSEGTFHGFISGYATLQQAVGAIKCGDYHISDYSCVE